MDKQSDIQINLNEENILLEGKQKQVQEKTSEKQNERNLIQKQIDELEK
jgi:HSP20 family molecular chaperone IbpA